MLARAIPLTGMPPEEALRACARSFLEGKELRVLWDRGHVYYREQGAHEYWWQVAKRWRLMMGLNPKPQSYGGGWLSEYFIENFAGNYQRMRIPQRPDGSYWYPGE